MLGCVIQLIPDQGMPFPLQGSELIMLYLGPASSIVVTQGLFWSNLSYAFDTEQQSRTTGQVTGAEATQGHLYTTCLSVLEKQSCQGGISHCRAATCPAALSRNQLHWRVSKPSDTHSPPEIHDPLQQLQKHYQKLKNETVPQRESRRWRSLKQPSPLQL